MVYKDALTGSLNVKNIYDLFAYKRNFYKSNPTYFDPDGLTIFVGPQGSGKTLSAVKYVEKLLNFYPKAILVTNIELTEFPIVTFEDYFQQYINLYQEPLTDSNDDLEIKKIKEEIQKEKYHEYLLTNKVFPFLNSDDLKRYNNGKEGVIFLVDEIQLYFNSLNSKNIDPEVMVQISQQRKQRKHIVATSQVFGRMAKPLREQFSSVILCKRFFSCLQKNSLLDRDSLDSDESTGTNLKGKVIKNFWWLHNPKDYNKYDTYNVINNDFKSSKGVDIYGSGLTSNN